MLWHVHKAYEASWRPRCALLHAGAGQGDATPMLERIQAPLAPLVVRQTPELLAAPSSRTAEARGLGHGLLMLLERVMGFEPTTTSLGSWCSTPELHPQNGPTAKARMRRRFS